MPRCKSCSASIYWATTPANKPLPLNDSPVDEGTWVWVDGKRARPLTAEELADPDVHRNRRYLPHWTVCPDAGEWRKKSIEKAPATEPAQKGLFDVEPAEW